MKSEPDSTALVKGAPAPACRPARFEDVAEILRLVTRSVAFGCRAHYDAEQRSAVCVTYARGLFVETLGSFETVVAELEGRLVGFAQVDPAEERLRALFVDADLQRRGVGRTLLAHVEARAARRGCKRLHGAMSLNAVPFYASEGFRACDGAPRLMASEGGVVIPVVRMDKRLTLPLR
jgi:putative acetyltransferase